MEQYKRKDFAHYYNTATPQNPSWKREGVGVDALSLSFNPQIDQYKTILDDMSDATFNNYQVQASISGKRIYQGDDIWDYLNTARKNSTYIETEMLEIDMKSLNLGSYDALKYNVLIVINEFLGENSTISYDLYVKGSPVIGTATISNGTPTFTATASL